MNPEECTWQFKPRKGPAAVRLSEDIIKEAILHPDADIRCRATRYFARSFSSDTSIMPLVIKAVETSGRQNDAYRLIGLSRDLQQNEKRLSYPWIRSSWRKVALASNSWKITVIGLQTANEEHHCGP